jgi:hypothetical protein
MKHYSEARIPLPYKRRARAAKERFIMLALETRPIVQGEGTTIDPISEYRTDVVYLFFLLLHRNHMYQRKTRAPLKNFPSRNQGGPHCRELSILKAVIFSPQAEIAAWKIRRANETSTLVFFIAFGD